MAKEVLTLIIDFEAPDPSEVSPAINSKEEFHKIIISGCATNGISYKGHGNVFGGGHTFSGEFVCELVKT